LRERNESPFVSAIIDVTNSSSSIPNKNDWFQLWHPRETIELIVIATIGLGILAAREQIGEQAIPFLTWLLVVWSFLKTAYYFGETLWHLIKATACDLAYHRFLLLMAYNMAEVTVSYALDFYCLFRLNPTNIEGIAEELRGPALYFECLYFSILNFSFFGYGDILPATVPAKIVMLLEVVTAFTTVIFLISDFVSMKDSMKRQKHG
jgi:type III secretory pathway component EscS